MPGGFEGSDGAVQDKAGEDRHCRSVVKHLLNTHETLDPVTRTARLDRKKLAQNPGAEFCSEAKLERKRSQESS